MTVVSPKIWDSYWDAIVGPRLKAHWRWYNRGRTGDGRLVVQDQDLRGAQIRSLEGARLERCDLSGSALSLMTDIELVDCIFDEANLMTSGWQRAKINNCSFRGAFMGAADFENAIVEGGDWT